MRSLNAHKLVCYMGVVGEAILCVFLLVYLFFLLMPMSYWVEYRSVEPFYLVVNHKGNQSFVSDRVIKRKINGTYNDILHCESYGFGNARYYQDSRRINNPPGDAKLIWMFDKRLSGPDVCYGEHNISIDLPFGITKETKIIGARFKIDKELK